jgi:hypothetical protein
MTETLRSSALGGVLAGALPIHFCFVVPASGTKPTSNAAPPISAFRSKVDILKNRLELGTARPPTAPRSALKSASLRLTSSGSAFGSGPGLIEILE